MSLDPDSLDIGIATATYQDMLQMVDDEKKLRKNLLEWVSMKSERGKYFVPDFLVIFFTQ